MVGGVPPRTGGPDQIGESSSSQEKLAASRENTTLSKLQPPTGTPPSISGEGQKVPQQHTENQGLGLRGGFLRAFPPKK